MNMFLSVTVRYAYHLSRMLPWLLYLFCLCTPTFLLLSHLAPDQLTIWNFFLGIRTIPTSVHSEIKLCFVRPIVISGNFSENTPRWANQEPRNKLYTSENEEFREQSASDRRYVNRVTYSINLI